MFYHELFYNKPFLKYNLTINKEITIWKYEDENIVDIN